MGAVPAARSRLTSTRSLRSAGRGGVRKGQCQRKRGHLSGTGHPGDAIRFLLNRKMRHRLPAPTAGNSKRCPSTGRRGAGIHGARNISEPPGHGRGFDGIREAHDPAKANGVNETLQKYESKTAQLMRGLKQKYDAVPKISPRPVALSPAAAAAAAAATAAMASAPGSSLASVSTEALEKELAWRREEASGEDLFTPAAAVAAQKTLENVVLVGGGPAGLSAAIYGKRLFWAKEVRSAFSLSPFHLPNSSFSAPRRFVICPPAARAGLKPVVLAPASGTAAWKGRGRRELPRCGWCRRNGPWHNRVNEKASCLLRGEARSRGSHRRRPALGERGSERVRARPQ